MSPELYFKVVLCVLTGLVGLCVGSFLNVVIYRLPEHMSLATPPSKCPKCGYKLRWFDNIPIFSYLFLNGKCRQCREKISPRYLIVELSNMILWLLCLFRFATYGWRGILCAVTAAIACSLCLCIALIDLDRQIVFDRFQIMMGVLAVLFTIGDTETGWISHLIGGVAGGLAFWLIGLIVSRRVGQDALGGGDVKFAAVTGLFLGGGKFVIMVLIASISACIVLLTLGKKSTDENRREYPFGPFLTAGFIIALFGGEWMIHTYLRILGME